MTSHTARKVMSVLILRVFVVLVLFILAQVGGNCNGLVDGIAAACFPCTDSFNVRSELFSCPESCADGACYAPNIVVIGWDGVQRDHLRQCYNREPPECSMAPAWHQRHGATAHSTASRQETGNFHCAGPYPFHQLERDNE